MKPHQQLTKWCGIHDLSGQIFSIDEIDPKNIRAHGAAAIAFAVHIFGANVYFWLMDFICAAAAWSLFDQGTRAMKHLNF